MTRIQTCGMGWGGEKGAEEDVHCSRPNGQRIGGRWKRQPARAREDCVSEGLRAKKVTEFRSPSLKNQEIFFWVSEISSSSPHRVPTRDIKARNRNLFFLTGSLLGYSTAVSKSVRHEGGRMPEEKPGKKGDG